MESTPEATTEESVRTGWWRSVTLSVLLVVAVALAGCESTDGGPPTSADASAPAPDVLAGLPAEVRQPAAPTALPTDRAVGPGALLYHIEGTIEWKGRAARSQPQDVHLLTRSGEQFRVGSTPAEVGPLNLSLSPDGRWLAAKREDRWSIRDLTATTELAVPTGYELRRWSTDSASVLLAQLPASSRAFTVLSLPDGKLRRLDVPGTPLTDAVALVDGRQLVTYDLDVSAMGAPASPQLDVTVRSLDTGATRVLPVLRAGQLRPGETFNAIAPLVHGGGTPARIWVQLGRPDLVPTGLPEGMPATPPVALIGVDVRSGEPAGRIDLPAPRKGSAELYLGPVGAEVVLQRVTGDHSELVAVDPATAERRVVTTLPGSARVFVPGELG